MTGASQPAASALDEARQELAEIGTALGPLVFRRIDERTDMPFREALSDVVVVTLLLGDALPKGRDAWERYMEYAFSDEDEPEKPPVSAGVDLEAARVLYKAFFFFVRAFQDHIYAVLSELQTGQRAAPEKSMGDALNNPRNPVGALLRERAETDYFAWFKEFRRKRNDLKEGVSVGLGQSGEAFGIVLGRLTEPRAIYMGPELGEADVIEALRQTTAALRVIRDWSPA